MGNVSELTASNDRVRDALKQIAEGFNTLAEVLPYSQSVIAGQLTNILAPTTTVAPTTETVEVPPPTQEVQESTPVVETSVLDDNDGVRVDKHGVPWDERIHSGKNAEKAEFNKDGEWKRRRGVLKEDFDRITAELKGARFTQSTPPVEQVQESTPPATAGQVPPPAGNVPPPSGSVPPPAGNVPPPTAVETDPKSEQFYADKASAVEHYKILTDELNIDHADLCEEVSQVIGIPVKDDQVEFGGATYEQTTALRVLWEGRVATYRLLNGYISDMRVWGGDDYQEYVDNAINAELSKVNTDDLSGVHYSDLPAFVAAMEAQYETWTQWAKDNKRFVEKA